MRWGSGVAVVGALLALGVAGHAAAPPPALDVPGGLRVLVVAPHPDDESLGAGGLIQRVRAGGGTVAVLFMTNGDGFPEAATVVTGDTHPDALEFRGLGTLRRAEALAALARYGLEPRSATFLGFPDGGLGAILAHPGARVAWESPYTRAATVPYPDAVAPGARYLHDEAVTLIAETLDRVAPDWVVLPTPRDTHADHCATFAFVRAALAVWVRRGEGVPPRLLAYLVHDGAWPPGPGVPGPLPVPASTFAGARWYTLPLAPAEVAAKREALAAHRTQTAVMEGFLRSLTRENELFAVVEPEAVARLDVGPCPAAGGDGAPPPVHARGH